MKKKTKVIVGVSAAIVGTIASGFLGALLYEVFAETDGTIYMDPDDKSIYASLKKDPDDYKNLSRLVFRYKKGAQ